MKTPMVCVIPVLMAGLASATTTASDWHNPVFADEAAALQAATAHATGPAQDPALHLFLDATLGPDRRLDTTRRVMVGNLMVSHPETFARNPTQDATIRRFLRELPRQQRTVERRLARFGYPEIPGLVYCRLVESVDAFRNLNGRSSDRMSQVGGVTYYCRYVVLPLSYVGEQSIEQLRRQTIHNPTLDVEGTLRAWERKSFTSLVNTFRHELVHVHTNSALGTPAFADRTAVPTWFHEGTATYLSGDPTAGLSVRYQEYQRAFFYLAERRGIRRLGDLYRTVLGGSGVSRALRDIYGIEGSDALFVASGRWHRLRETTMSVFWLSVLVVLVTAFRSERLPVLAALRLLVGLGLVLAIAGGVAERLWGLHGPQAVLAAEAVMGVVAAIATITGVASLRRNRRD
jgi:hypothetical protein